MEDQWIPIFKDGRVTDSQGREHDGSELIEKALATFNASEHEPPVVIGHPKNNAPAYGWIADLKRDGQFLMAKLKQVAPEFADLVKRGLYKKRSAAFYADGSLRHLAFLGAVPPAVKGLADVAFDEGDSLVFEFTDHTSHKFGTIARIFRGLRDILIDKFDIETADAVVQGFDIDFIKEEDREDDAVQPFNEPIKPTEGKNMSKTFTEEELKKEKQEAADAARKEEREKVEAEFAEKEKDKPSKTEFEEMQANLKKQSEDLEKQKADAHKKNIGSFCEQLKAAGKYLPAFDDMGMRTFMQGLDHQAEVEFSAEKKQTPLDFMKSFLEALPSKVNFEEISKDEKGDPKPKSKDDHLVDKKAFDQDGLETHNKALAFAEENKCTYEEALDSIDS